MVMRGGLVGEMRRIKGRESRENERRGSRDRGG